MFSIHDWLEKTQSLLRFFYVQRIRGFSPPAAPSVDEPTEEWLTNTLRTARSYIEFGAGGSTLLANRLQVPTVSVESDRFYAAAVRGALTHPELCTIITPPMGITRQWGTPLFRKASKGPFYVNAPFEFCADQFPDLIFVDGRYRVACVLESAVRAKAASARSTLLLDDYDRTSYHVLEAYLGPPERIGRAAKFVLGDVAIDRSTVCRHSHDVR
jgi:hypothetical protein